MNVEIRKETETDLLGSSAWVKKVPPPSILGSSTVPMSWRKTLEGVYKKWMVMKGAMELEKLVAGVFAAVQISQVHARVLT